MNSTKNSSYDSYNDRLGEILNRSITSKMRDSSIDETLAGFGKLRISALTKAVELSPLVKEATIGPNSPAKKELIYEEKQIPAKIEPLPEDLVEDKLRGDLGYNLIMKECEAQLHQLSVEFFRKSFEQMICKRAEIMNKCFQKYSEQRERRDMKYHKRKLQLQKDFHENDNLNVLKIAKLDEQNNSAMINRQTIDNMNRILEEQNKATARFAAITDSHTKICICYNEITNVIASEPLSQQVCDKYIPTIKTVISNISAIMELCKNASVTDKEVKQAEILSLNLENVLKKILNEINEIKEKERILKDNERELLKLKEIEEKKARELAEKEAQETKVPEVTKTVKIVRPDKTKVKPMFYSSKNYNYFKELSNFMISYEAQYSDLLENVNMKKFRFDCQKAVNTPVNALSSVSSTHMKDKYEKLYKLLKGESVQVLDIYFTVTQHPHGVAYCTALLAKKIVRQGELLVSSHPEAAFPLAAVVIALWASFPDFGKLLLANFHKQCPYLVPMFMPQKEGQTDKEFYLSRGYTYNDEGVVEKQDKFLKRMSGIFRLICAIWIMSTPKFINIPNPHGLQYGWQWLASFINLKPEPDICATLLYDFFTVCGSKFLLHYKIQFIKLIKLISTDYLEVLQNIDEGGPKTRLEVLLQNILKTGHIDPPSGLLQSDIW